MRATILGVAIQAAMLAAIPTPFQAASVAIPVLTPTVVYVPVQYHTGGAYTAIQASADGRVYLGTTIYNGYAHLLQYVPSTGRFESVAEMSSATGERNPGPYAQAKIHTKPAIAPDGRVYFGTKSGKPARRAEWQQNYPGGHLLVYDPRSGRTSDLGIIKPRVSIIAVGVDPTRGLVYALTDPDNHLVVYDPAARTFTDRGLFGPQDEAPSRYLVVLSNGDAFHQLGDSTVARYNASTATIERLSVVLTGSGTYEPPYAVSPSADGRRFVGVGNSSGQVYLFEPRQREVGIRILGSATPEGYGPSSHYTMTTAPDGSVYYTAQLSSGGGRDLFIHRISGQGQVQTRGRVAPLAPPPPDYPHTTSRGLVIQGSTATPDGTLIVMLAYPLRLLLFRGIAAR